MQFSSILRSILFFFFVCLSCSIDGKIIWKEEPLSEKQFSFSGYQRVLINPVFFSEATERKFIDILKKSLGTKGKIVFLNEITPDLIDAFGKISLFFNASLYTTKNKEIKGLLLTANARVTADENHFNFLTSVWENSFLFQIDNQFEEELYNSMTKSVNAFVSDFFQTNPKAVGNALFYYPDPEKKYEAK